MMRCRTAAAALVLGLAAAALRADAPPPAADRGTVIVTLADGSTVPLRGWTLSYEYAIWGKGVSPVAAPTARRDSGDLYLGKRVVPARGLSTVDVVYQELGGMHVARTVTIQGTGDTKGTKEKVEPPHADLVAPDRPKGRDVMVRTLDLRGETVTGTKRDFCVLSYTTVVQCGTTREDRVVKLQFLR